MKPLKHPTPADFQGFYFSSKSGSFYLFKKDLDILHCGIIKSLLVNIV